MNSFAGKILGIEQEESLSLIRVQVGGLVFTTIVIDTPETAPYLAVGHPVQVLFKETEVLIGIDIQPDQISLQNKIAGTIAHIEEGKLLSRLVLDSPIGKVVSIITTHAVQQLRLREGSSVTALIKTNEIMLAQ